MIDIVNCEFPVREPDGTFLNTGCLAWNVLGAASNIISNVCDGTLAFCTDTMCGGES